MWLGKEPGRACGVCTSIQRRRWPAPAARIPFTQQAGPFVLLLGVGKVIATLCSLSCSKEQIAKDLLSGEEEEETQSSADDLTPSVTSHEASDLFHNQSGCRSHRPGAGGFVGEMPWWPWVGLGSCELPHGRFELRQEWGWA